MKTVNLEEIIKSINDKLFSSLHSEIVKNGAIKGYNKEALKKISSVQSKEIRETIYNLATAYFLLETLQKDLKQISATDKNKIVELVNEFYDEASMLLND